MQNSKRFFTKSYAQMSLCDVRTEILSENVSTHIAPAIMQNKHPATEM